MPRFCTALDEGRPCTTRALAGQAFCYGHHPAAFEYQRCAYLTNEGQQCRALALRGQDHCFNHSPRNRRTQRPAIPLIAGESAKKARAKWFVLSKMPVPGRPLPQTP